MDTHVAEEAKKTLRKQEQFLPPISPSNNQQPGISSTAHYLRSRKLHSSLPTSSHHSLRSSLSSSISGARSEQSGSSALGDREGTKFGIRSSIDYDTLAIAIELRNLKARREKDEQETLARILDVPPPPPRSKTTSSIKVNKTSPPTGVYTGPGAHFLDWYIPRHVAGSQASERTASAVFNSRKGMICSPLHGLEKQEWTEKLIDPKASGLRIPTAVPPRIIDYPCTWQSSIQDVLKKYLTKVDSHHSGSSSPQYYKTKSSQLKSLALSPTKSKKQSRSSFPIDTSDHKLNGSMFSRTHVAPMPWFIVHPDWRTEPRIPQTWEATKDKTDE